MRKKNWEKAPDLDLDEANFSRIKSDSPNTSPCKHVSKADSLRCKHKGVRDHHEYIPEDYKYCLEEWIMKILSFSKVLTLFLEVINNKLQWWNKKDSFGSNLW